MRRCVKCNAPLEGILGKITKKIFKVTALSSNPEVCSKCEEIKIAPTTPGKYICQICDREIDERVALTHIKSEEYLINLIRKDHPDWDKDKKTCHNCVEYYRRLIKEGEI